MEFFSSMEPMLQTFWYIALAASLIFIIQTIMTFAGMDATDGVDADFNSDFSDTDAPFQLFSLRNLVNFLLGFGWGGICFWHYVESKLLVSAIALIVGVFFVWIFFVIIKQIQKLAEDNTFRIEEALNKACNVYLTIPAGKSGIGKIQVSVKGTTRELDAITLGEKIESGAAARVVKIESSNLVLVEKI